MGSKKLKGHKSQGKLYSFAFPQVSDWEGDWMAEKENYRITRWGWRGRRNNFFPVCLIFAYHKDLPVNLWALDFRKYLWKHILKGLPCSWVRRMPDFGKKPNDKPQPTSTTVLPLGKQASKQTNKHTNTTNKHTYATNRRIKMTSVNRQHSSSSRHLFLSFWKIPFSVGF